MTAIYKKELSSYFTNPLGYVFVSVYLIASALIFSYTTFKAKSYSTSSYFSLMIVAFIILIPLLTMRLFSEERKQKTEQMLMTAPVTITGMVLGKFFAAFTVYLGSLAVSLVNFIPLYAVAIRERAGDSYSVTHIGPVTGQIVGSFIGLVLVGAAFIAIGMFVSAFFEDQLAAAITTIGVILFMVAVGWINAMTDAEGHSIIGVYAIRFVLDWISVLSRFSNFGAGIFDFTAILYYFSIAGVFIFLTVRVYDRRRWA
jgi:ABC-2 type transport system permease protein